MMQSSSSTVRLVELVFPLLILFSYADAETFAQSSGLTDREAQTMLDFFNHYRAKVAAGQFDGQPPSADMTALEWDHALSHRAQEWASKCGGGKFDNLEDVAQGQIFAEWDQGPNGFLSYAMKEWVEVGSQGYDYLSNNYLDRHSYYTQVVTSYTHKVGCGYDKCSGYAKSRLVCNFYIIGNLPDVHPYKEGTACSKCPFGRPYCLGESLCVRQDQCLSSNTHCDCSINFAKCSEHGTPVESKCHCECHAGWTGANCDVECKDNTDCSQISPDYCFAPNSYLTFMNRQCAKFCSLCKNIDMKSKVNTRGLTVNVLVSKQNVLAGTTNIGVNTGEATDDRDETCKDDNLNCSQWAQIDECSANPNYMLVFCRRSCDVCGSCVNYNTNCRYWSSIGECSNNPTYMGENCRRSCAHCS